MSSQNSLPPTAPNDGSMPNFDESDFYLNIEDVQLGAQIGQGAFSKVYVGKYFGELVAVKKQKRAPADGLEAYLLRELAVLKHFEHPNLLAYIGASDVPGQGTGGASAIYIVTELAENGDLLALLLGEHPLSWKLRVSILLDAARALEFLHSKMLIHRDIKSPNMLLDARFCCKIADFGMARQVGANMTIVGTDAYMAPELMFDEPYDTSADTFSFGIVLWECIYRKKAGYDGFAERRPSDRFHLNAEDLHAQAPPDTPASLLSLAAQLCEYEPDGRPSAEDTFLWLEDLHNELDDGADEDAAMTSIPTIDYEHLFASAQGGGVAATATGAAAPAAAVVAAAVAPAAPQVTAPLPAEIAAAAAAALAGRSPAKPPAAPQSEAPAAPAPMPPLPQNYSSTFMSSSSNSGGGGGSTIPVQNGALAGSAGLTAAAGTFGSTGGGGGFDSRRQSGAGLSSSTSAIGTGLTSRSPSPGRLRGAAHAPITKCGYLHKKGKSGMKNWQKRWFVLEGTKLIWYKDSKQYPKEPRGFLELRGCFIVRGLFFRWKILNADGSADQEDYNRDLAAKDAGDMEQWLTALQAAMDAADTGEGLPQEMMDDSMNSTTAGSNWGINSSSGAGIGSSSSGAAAAAGGQERRRSSSGLHDSSAAAGAGEHRVHDGGENDLRGGGGLSAALNAAAQRVVSMSTMAVSRGFRVDQSVEDWLCSLGLGHLSPVFRAHSYHDVLMIQEMGLTSEDLTFMGIVAQGERRLLKVAARGMVEALLTVRVSGFFNFGTELVYRLDSKWRFLRASTFFRFQDFEELHRKLKAAMKDTKYAKLMPALPTRPGQSVLKLGSIDHATQMARLQQQLHKYVQKLTMLVGAKEPFFTMLCGHLDLLPPDPARLPNRADDFLARMQMHLEGQGDRIPSITSPPVQTLNSTGGLFTS